MKVSNSKIGQLIWLVVAIVALSLMINRCSQSHYNHVTSEADLARRHANIHQALIADLDDGSLYEAGFDSMPDGGQKLHINYLGANLGLVFNDSNYLHLDAARQIGIKPIKSSDDLLRSGAPLRKVVSGPYVYVDQLNHSLPYLVPEAADLLHDIGKAFADTLQARGGGDYRIKVTSVLRTPETISRLRRRNVNAVEESAHIYATTFDISYAKFICDDPKLPRTQEDLKNLLGEVLFKLREQGRCYVKYERKQGCFHITARGHADK